MSDPSALPNDSRLRDRPSAWRDFLVSAALSIGFMLATGVQSAATLAHRANATDTMKAAARGAWSGRIGEEVAYFAFAQLALHLAFAFVIWLVARSSVAIRPALRAKSTLVVVAWFCALAAATLVYNALWFPRTGLGAYYHDIVATTVGSLAVGQIVYMAIVACALAVVGLAIVRTARRMSHVRGNGRLVVAAGIGALGVVGVLVAATRTGAGTATPADKPHVIVLGIDSLRLDYLARYGGQGLTPNIDRFLASADLVPDTTTPAARTFSSWVAILTGRSPPATGARFNLADRETVSANPTVADVLRSRGYRTVYSTDEVRFANIDETFGFDQVITPPIGASDFLIGTFNELPLACLIVNTRLGQLLFPFSYANRGVATLYQPATYLERLDRELQFDGPTLLMLHLTASHWPYYVSDVPFGASQMKDPEDRPMYRLGVELVDQMFGRLVALLEEKGALENALVVVLSDHGEALRLKGDSLFGERPVIEGLGTPIMLLDYGHGQSVLSPVQYQVLLGFRSFGARSGFDAAGRVLEGGATVEDISPTILDLLGIDGDPLSANGSSLAAALRDRSASPRVADPERVRFTETDLRVLPNPDATVDEIATARNNSMFFAVNPETARLSIRQRYVPLALAFKERAAFDEERLLAALPAGSNAHQYVLVDKTSGKGRLLLARPGPEAPEEARLWDALWGHYAGELKPAMRVTEQDWPAIDQSWLTFFSDLAQDTTLTRVDSAPGETHQ